MGDVVIVMPVTVAAFTVTVVSCVKLVVAVAPLVMVALTTTGPVPVVFKVVPLTLPGPLTNDHTMAWLVAVEGTTVPLKVNGIPIVVDVGTPVMLVTATKGAATLMV